MNDSYIEIELVFDVNFIRAIGFYDLEFFCNFFHQIVFVRSDKLLDKFKFENFGCNFELIFQPFKINRFLSI